MSLLSIDCFFSSPPLPFLLLVRAGTCRQVSTAAVGSGAGAAAVLGAIRSHAPAVLQSSQPAGSPMAFVSPPATTATISSSLLLQRPSSSSSPLLLQQPTGQPPSTVACISPSPSSAVVLLPSPASSPTSYSVVRASGPPISSTVLQQGGANTNLVIGSSGGVRTAPAGPATVVSASPGLTPKTAMLGGGISVVRGIGGEGVQGVAIARSPGQATTTTATPISGPSSSMVSRREQTNLILYVFLCRYDVD